MSWNGEKWAISFFFVRTWVGWQRICYRLPVGTAWEELYKQRESSGCRVSPWSHTWQRRMKSELSWRNVFREVLGFYSLQFLPVKTSSCTQLADAIFISAKYSSAANNYKSNQRCYQKVRIGIFSMLLLTGSCHTLPRRRDESEKKKFVVTDHIVGTDSNKRILVVIPGPWWSLLILPSILSLPRYPQTKFALTQMNVTTLAFDDTHEASWSGPFAKDPRIFFSVGRSEHIIFSQNWDGSTLQNNI